MKLPRLRPVRKKPLPRPFVGNRTNACALQGETLGGVPAMPSAAYFRRQADICVRLSLIASDEEVSNRLIIMAREYTAKGDAMEKEAEADPPPSRERTALPNVGRDDVG